MKRAIRLHLVVIQLVLSAGTLAAQSADEVIRTALERYEQRVADVEDFTLIQEVNGMAMGPSYFEKQEKDGRTVFVAPSPAELALRGTGFNVAQLRDFFLGSLTKAGMQQVVAALEGATGEEVAGLVGALGDELLTTAGLPGSGGAAPGERVASAVAAGAGDGITGELARAVLQGVKEGDFKQALLSAAKRVGMNAAVNALEAATGVQVGAVVDALANFENFGDAMGNLAKALPSVAAGLASRAAGLPGLASAAQSGAQATPGPLGGPPGAAGMAGNIADPQALMASGMMSGAASAGLSMLSNAAFRGLAGLVTGGGKERVDEFVILGRLQGRARIDGSEKIDGRECWVLVADDVAGLDFGAGDEFAPASLTLLLDVEELVPRGGAMEGEMTIEGERRPVTARLSIEDYREVGGMLHPFSTTVAFEGLGQTMSEEDRRKMKKEAEKLRKEMERSRKQREEMEQQLAQLPPEQRRMVEQQLGNLPAIQERALRQMEAMAEGIQEMTIVVKEMRVNEGPPEELLAPTGSPMSPAMPGMHMPERPPPR